MANFDLTFAYILIGWEGSDDSRVYDDARTKGLPLLANKYFLGDGGYGLSKYMLTPYRGVRYHLIEYAVNGIGPANYKELFNLRHSSLRDCVERLYGIKKNRFPVLKKMSPYDYEFQCNIIQSCFLIHNFVRLNQLYEDEFCNVELVNNPNDDDDEIEDQDEGGLNMQEVKISRNNIALAMWAQYQLNMAQINAH